MEEAVLHYVTTVDHMWKELFLETIVYYTLTSREESNDKARMPATVFMFDIAQHLLLRKYWA